MVYVTVTLPAGEVKLEFENSKCESGFAILEWLDKKYPHVDEARNLRWLALQAKANAARG